MPYSPSAFPYFFFLEMLGPVIEAAGYVAFIISVIGPIIGIVVGSLWLGPESSPVRRRDGRELLVICSVLFVIQVAMFALMLTGALGALSGAAQFPLGLPF